MENARLGKFTAYFENGKEYHTLKREIFGGHCYYIELENRSPHILDIGAHIGLSVMYFKMLFPACKIVAYEPHPDSFHLLNQNIIGNELKDIITHNFAVSTGEDEIILHEEDDANPWRSTLSFHAKAWNESQITVPAPYHAIPFPTILTEHFDLVKLDVEGMELNLVKSIKNLLKQADHWIIEVHGHDIYDPEELLQIFQEQGFNAYLEVHGAKVKSYKFKGLALLHADVL